MLQSWGSSSRLVFRKNFPMGVMNASAEASRWVATCGVSARIVRNFGIKKIALRRPTRFDQCNARPGEVKRTPAPKTAKTGNKASRRAEEKATSNRRFIPDALYRDTRLKTLRFTSPSRFLHWKTASSRTAETAAVTPQRA